MWLVLLGACVGRHRGAAEDPLDAALAAADRLWAHRAEDGGLAAALAAYEALLGSSADPRVLARVARARHHLGLVSTDPAEAQAAYEVAREVAERCMAEDPDVAALLPGVGWRWTPEVLVRVEADRAPCLTWALAATVGVVRIRGPGALLEAEAAAPLVARALVLIPGEAWVRHSAGSLALLDPRLDGEARALALAELEAAVAAAPGLLLFERDLAQARGEDWAPPPENAEDPYPLENRALRGP